MSVNSLLDEMRKNPAGDWKIGDIQTVCQAVGVTCAPPRGGGSHYKISHPGLREILTVPSRRPIKAVYIRKLVSFLKQVPNG